MEKEITYKLQSNDTHSWVITYTENGEFVKREMLYESPTNKMHNERLQAILTEHDYLSIGEVSMWLNNEDFGAEAQSIIHWWIETCKLVAEYVALHPQEEDCINFINNLPTL